MWGDEMNNKYYKISLLTVAVLFIVKLIVIYDQLTFGYVMLAFIFILISSNAGYGIGYILPKLTRLQYKERWAASRVFSLYMITAFLTLFYIGFCLLELIAIDIEYFMILGLGTIPFGLIHEYYEHQYEIS